jgi:hypothetical protein
MLLQIQLLATLWLVRSSPPNSGQNMLTDNMPFRNGNDHRIAE